MAIDNVPNEGAFSSNRANNGFLPLTGSRPTAVPPNASRLMHGDPGGSADLTRRASPIDPPNASTFRNGDKGGTDKAPAAVTPGKPAIPTNPFVTDAALLGRPPSKTLESR